ncbi:unnamed protein product [Clavelina lepadiformis]|uniref:dolichyl-phosphate-mannose--protein mannosyltransferase n=1 Tax=Clavelina lepadiformis TaxID=159417 RepID=A0ABP0FVS6_CLALP
MLSDNAGRPKTKKAFYNFLLQMNYPWKTETFCTFIAFLIYTNTFNAGFVFDDNRAIIENADVLGINPLYNLFLNDFWGTPLNHSGSHGSYRPITVLTFRINYLLFALEPGPYHVTNVVLHSLTTFLLCYVVKWILKLSTSKTFCAGMMFALHPVHTEAVSGVVGRADVMATMFSLAALIFYYKWCNCMDCAEKSSSDEDGEKVVQCGRFVQTLTHRATKSNKKKPKNRPIRAMTATTSKQTAKMEKSAAHSEHISADGNVEAKHKMGSRLAANYSSDAIQANTDAYDGVSSTASYDSEASHFEETFKSNCEFAMGKSETTEASFKVKNLNRKSMNSDARSVYASSTSPDEVKPISTIQNSANDESGFSKSSRSPFSKRYYLIISFFLCAVLALLSKEQGYCAPLLCAAYDLYIRNKLGVKESISALCLQEKRFRPLRRRIFIIFLFILIMMSFRLGLPVVLSGGKYMVPTFSPSDNPAAANESLLTRTLTFNYLLFCNFWLLICPRTLSFDWSMDAIPLISDISDSRNFLTLAFYFGLFCVAKYLWKRLMNVDQSKESSPHLNCTSNQPTQNRAQSRRRLSTSSEDNDLYHTHCDGNDWNNNSKLSKRTRDLKQTSLRRRRGLTELLIERRFELGTNPQFDATLLSTCFLTFSFLPASNLFFYVGFVLAERLLYMPSVGFCIIATDVIFHHLPKDIDFFKLFRSFLANIISVERRHRSTERLSTWIKVLVLLLYISSFAIKTWSRNYDWKDEMTLYSAGVAVNPAKALGNLGNALREQGKVEAAENAYIEALQKRPNMADVYYNLGVLYQELRRHQMAEESYKKAIQFKPRFALAHLNLGVVVSLQGRKKEAKLVYLFSYVFEN